VRVDVLRRISLFLLLATTAAPPHLHAATIDVATFGAIPGDSIDDTTAINNAIAASTAADTVVLNAGTYDVSNKIVTKAGLTMQGAGNTTILRRTGNNTAPLLGIENVSNVTLSNFTLDGNNNKKPSQGIYAATGSNINLHDLTIQNLAATTGFGPHGIYFDHNVTNSTIANNSISNIGTGSQWGCGIRVAWYSSNNQVLNNTVANTGRGGILCNDQSTDLVIRNNTVTGSGGTGLGIEVWGGSHRAVVEDNHIDHWLSVDGSNDLAVRRNTISDHSGVYKYTGLELVDASNCVFTDNVVDGGQQLGISISGPALKNNIYWGHNTISGASTWGVQIQGETNGAKNQYFFKNIFIGTIKSGPNTLYAPQGHGVRFNGDANGIVFDNNEITANQGQGIQLTGSNLRNLTFTSNTITNNAGAAATSDGVTNLYWADNTISGNGSDNPLPSSTTKANVIDNPFGDFRIRVGQPLRFGLREDAAAGVDHVLWDFGTGLPSTELNPTFAYDVPGTYRVTMIAWGDDGGAPRFEEQTLTVTPEPGAVGLVGLMLMCRGARRSRRESAGRARVAR